MQTELDRLNIMPRTPGYTNEMMLQYCEQLKSIADKDSKTSDLIRHRINESYEYYRTLHFSENEFEWRDYQVEIISRGCSILTEHRFLYLAMEVRTGKTLTSLGIAENVGAKNVLFVTKKKAIRTIQADYEVLKATFDLTVINYESLHTVMNDKRWDMIILDEAHSLGAFPKPSERAKTVRDVIAKYKPMVILMSGTPTPESYSQMYHQVYGIPNNPFKEFSNFYKFCQKYVKVTERKINGMFIRDYSNGYDTIIDTMKPYTINYSQSEAGFKVKTTETILTVDMKPSTYNMINRLKKDLIIEGKEEVILADTAVKLMSKVHQLCSGTIKFESGNSMVIDTSKAEFIRSYFFGKKIGIFYKFKEELSALQSVFVDSLTTDLKEFETTGKNIALQIVSGREGISLKDAECLVYYNIDFSATSYWQSKDRMTTKDRLHNNIYWVFAKDGIEHDIYKTVIKKKDYTLTHFKKQL